MIKQTPFLQNISLNLEKTFKAEIVNYPSKMTAEWT